jgi:DHA1 family inner membrane transport protein
MARPLQRCAIFSLKDVHMKPVWALLALAVGAFGIGTTEFSPMGLLPVISTGIGVSIPTAGMLITAYALGVMIGAPLMTLALSRFPMKRSLILLMGIFVIGNLLSAVAMGYWTLLAARVITSMSHGAFFGLGSVLAASLVPQDKRASAVATMFMGLTIANIGGVPAATWIGQQIGWRMAFAATAVLGLLAIAALAFSLPAGQAGERPNVRRELKVLTRPAVLMSMATTVMGAGAMFTLYTYVAPVLATLTGASAAFITLCLVLIGLGFTIGNSVGGRLADWSLDGAAKLFLGLLALTMFVLPLLLASHIGAAVGLLLWGLVTFAIVPPVQIRVMQAAADAPGLASSVNVGAFNLGNAVGAALGGGVLAAGWSYAAVPVAGGLLALGGLMLVFAGQARKPMLQRTAPDHSV